MARIYSDRPYKTLLEAADYLAYDGTTKHGRIEAVKAFLKARGVPKFWRGKKYVVHPDDLDAALRGETVSVS